MIALDEQLAREVLGLAVMLHRPPGAWTGSAEDLIGGLAGELTVRELDLAALSRIKMPHTPAELSAVIEQAGSIVSRASGQVVYGLVAMLTAALATLAEDRDVEVHEVAAEVLERRMQQEDG